MRSEVAGQSNNTSNIGGGGGGYAQKIAHPTIQLTLIAHGIAINIAIKLKLIAKVFPLRVLQKSAPITHKEGEAENEKVTHTKPPNE